MDGLYLGSHCPGSDHFPARLESFRPLRLGRTRSVVVRNFDVWWRLTVKHFQVMHDALSGLGDRTLKLNTATTTAKRIYKAVTSTKIKPEVVLSCGGRNVAKSIRHITEAGGPIWTKFGFLMQNNTPITAKWLRPKPEVVLQYNGRLFF